MVSVPVKVKNTFISADCDVNCVDEDGSLSLSRRQFSAPCPGASPLRGLDPFESGRDYTIDKAKDLPVPECLQPAQQVPEFEPEGEPHAMHSARQHTEEKPGGVAKYIVGQRWADMDEPCTTADGIWASQPRSALSAKLPSSKEAPPRGQMMHRVSFHDPDEQDTSSGEGGADTGGADKDDLDDDHEAHHFCRLVTGGSEYASDAYAMNGATTQAMQMMPASYLYGMSQDGSMPMVPFLVAGGGMSPGQSLGWHGQGCVPLAQQQQMGMMAMAHQEQQMLMMQQQWKEWKEQQKPPQKSQQPQQQNHSQHPQQRQKQQPQMQTNVLEAQQSSNSRIAPSSKHSRGRGSLIDIAKREQALRQRAVNEQQPDGQTLSGAAPEQAQCGRSINFCPYCRGKVQAHHRFCQFCGASLSTW